tara:strand:+ start:1024 stop:1434 length:411 start_codon:yes stop_codon:yes gene_type:complete
MEVYSKYNSNKIWYGAWINLVATFYALMTPNWKFFIVPFSVFITSLLHWSNPINGSYRQQIDIIVVKTLGIYQIYRAYGSEYMYEYYIFLFCAILSYYYGCKYYHETTYEISCNYHIGLHIFATLSNIFLYTGYIP